MKALFLVPLFLFVTACEDQSDVTTTTIAEDKGIEEQSLDTEKSSDLGREGESPFVRALREGKVLPRRPITREDIDALDKILAERAKKDEQRRREAESGD